MVELGKKFKAKISKGKFKIIDETGRIIDSYKLVNLDDALPELLNLKYGVRKHRRV